MGTYFVVRARTHCVDTSSQKKMHEGLGAILFVGLIIEHAWQGMSRGLAHQSVASIASWKLIIVSPKPI